MNCANPKCHSECHYLRSGSLHFIDRDSGSRTKAPGEQRRTIWLCHVCSTNWSVEPWRPAGEQIRPHFAAQPSASSEAR